MKTLSEPHGSADGGTLTGAEEEARDQSRSRGGGGSVRAGTPSTRGTPKHFLCLSVTLCHSRNAITWSFLSKSKWGLQLGACSIKAAF